MGLSDFIEKMVLSHQIDFQEGHFEMMGIRGVNLPMVTLTALFEQIYARQGDELFDILFETGKEHGRYAVDELARKHGMNKQEFFSKMNSSGNVMGLGRFEIEELDTDRQRLVVSIHDSPIVAFFANSETFEDLDRPVDDLQRGIYHGIAAETFDTEVTSTEEQCAFQGADHCRVVITPAE